MRRATYEDVWNWIIESCEEITHECVRNSFKAMPYVYSDGNVLQANDDYTDNDSNNTASNNCVDDIFYSILKE